MALASPKTKTVKLNNKLVFSSGCGNSLNSQQLSAVSVGVTMVLIVLIYYGPTSVKIFRLLKRRVLSMFLGCLRGRSPERMAGEAVFGGFRLTTATQGGFYREVAITLTSPLPT
ncbi:hypothetical protein L1887_10761 [Cichorium endivia]|nr:hypothetical protein L1887_10761 [Cichorium endivia]